jgi:hypothetical protein
LKLHFKSISLSAGLGELWLDWQEPIPATDWTLTRHQQLGERALEPFLVVEEAARATAMSLLTGRKGSPSQSNRMQ